MKRALFLTLIALGSLNLPAAVTLAKFKAVTIDDNIKIGYGLAIADVNGDGKPDIVLADADNFAWYQNPTWKKHRITGKLTERDHVCVAARDIDGDGKAEIAVGAQWNPGDTENSGAVYYLIPQADRTQEWTPVKLPHDPTTHRMHWVRNESGKYQLVVLPLHGRGNKAGRGEPVRMMAYNVPADPRGKWTTEVIDASMHMTHNFDVFPIPGQKGEVMLVAGAEGITYVAQVDGTWRSSLATTVGAGEVRIGIFGDQTSYIAAVEPMHGSQLAIHLPPTNARPATTHMPMFNGMADGHALACGNLTGAPSEQIVVGWRGNRGDADNIGIRIYAPTGIDGSSWVHQDVDTKDMACEDLKLEDLNGDGRVDIIACGRATKNVKIYFNEGK